jgi:hypothetical protein
VSRLYLLFNKKNRKIGRYHLWASHEFLVRITGKKSIAKITKMVEFHKKFIPRLQKEKEESGLCRYDEQSLKDFSPFEFELSKVSDNDCSLLIRLREDFRDDGFLVMKIDETKMHFSLSHIFL